MSASSSDRLRTAAMLIATAVLGGCVTQAEQVASQSDISVLARSIDGSGVSDLDPDTFYAEAREMMKRPIEFHGRVIDDAGNPIRDAVIELSVFNQLVDPFEFPFFAYTSPPDLKSDRQGRFVVKGLKGAGMYVFVSVPGYQPVTPPRKLWVFAPELEAYEPPPTRQDPAKYVFEQRPPEAELRPIHTGALLLTENEGTLDLAIRTVAPYGVDPEDVEARVRCGAALDDPTPDARFDWWCELTIPGGGIQPFFISMDRAPLEGYEETLRFGYDADDERWDDRDDPMLIVKFADGTYGFVTFSMRMDGDYYVAFDGVWNPTGATWLD